MCNLCDASMNLADAPRVNGMDSTRTAGIRENCDSLRRVIIWSYYLFKECTVSPLSVGQSLERAPVRRVRAILLLTQGAL